MATLAQEAVKLTQYLCHSVVVQGDESGKNDILLNEFLIPLCLSLRDLVTVVTTLILFSYLVFRKGFFFEIHNELCNTML